MNAAPIPEDSDDKLESVAEELLGVDFTTPSSFADPLDLDDDDLFGDDPGDEPETATEAAADAEEEDFPAGEFDSADADDFGQGVDEPVEPEVPLRRGPSAPKARDDSYWDALEGWDWDEGAGSGERTPEPAKAEAPEEKPAPPQFASPSPSASRKTSEFREDDDFGAGLVDDAPAPSARPAPAARDDRNAGRKPAPETAPDRETEVRRERARDRDEDRPRGRGGRRDEGRGGRGRRERGEERPRREPPPTPPPVTEREIVEDDESDFGTGLVVEPQPGETIEPERGPRRGRRRRGRGRGRDRAAPAAQEAGASPPVREAPELDYGPEHEFELDDRSQVEQSQPEVDEFDMEIVSQPEAPAEIEEPRFGDVPTWAEAISYLFNPKVRSGPRSSDEGARREGESRGGSRRSSGGGDRGRRGGPRRGGRGRRPSSSGE